MDIETSPLPNASRVVPKVIRLRRHIRLPFSGFIALRYLRPKRTFLSLITLISVFGVVLGVSVLIIVISVMTGFERELIRKIIGFESDIMVRSPQLIANWRELLARVEQTPGVLAAAPVMQGRVIAEYQNRRLSPWLLGVEPDKQRKVTDFENFIVAGKFDLSGDTCVIGTDLAESLGCSVGDTLTVYSPGNLGVITDELKKAENDPNNKEHIQKALNLVLPSQLTITGLFNSGRYVYDSEFVVVPLHIGQEAYGLGDTIHAIQVKTGDPFQADRIKARLNQFLPAPVSASTWIDDNKEYFDAIRIERTTMFFVLIFVVIVAAFGIMSTLITTTVQKTREIGVMKALGAKVSQILWIFLAQGMIVGFFGTLIGLATGIILVQYRNQVRDFLAATFHVELFPAAVYQFPEIPAEIVPRDLVVICLSGFLICSLAALIPAYFAARLDPVKALRYE
jgi:lipoprotein-releasing system permease protein